MTQDFFVILEIFVVPLWKMNFDKKFQISQKEQCDIGFFKMRKNQAKLKPVIR